MKRGLRVAVLMAAPWTIAFADNPVKRMEAGFGVGIPLVCQNWAGTIVDKSPADMEEESREHNRAP